MTHPNQQQLLEFLGGAAPEPAAEVLYAHLDICPACAERLETLREIASDFDGAWGEFVEELTLRAERTRSVQETTPGWRLTLEGILDGVRRLSTLAVTDVSGAVRSLRPETVLVPAYAGVGDPDRAGVTLLATAASELCGEGRMVEALEVLREVQGRSPAAAAAASLELRVGEDVMGRIVVDARRRMVAVLVDRARMKGLGGWAQLESGESVRRASLEPVEAARYRLAEFEQVPDAAFEVRLHLVDRADPQAGSQDPHSGGKTS